MSKMKRMAALLMGAVVAIGSVPVINAEAVNFSSSLLPVPDGYVLSEELSDIYCWSEKSLTYVYHHEEEGVYSTISRFDFEYNLTKFTIPVEMIETFDSIYAEYSAELDMDYFKRNEPVDTSASVSAEMSDKYDENGELSFDITDGVDKQDAIQAMVDEMYNAGCVTETYYTAARMRNQRGSNYGSYVTMALDADMTDGEIAAFEAFALENGACKLISSNAHTGKFQLDIPLEELDSFEAALGVAYPGAGFSSDTLFLANIEYKSTERLNLLPHIEYVGACNADPAGYSAWGNEAFTDIMDENSRWLSGRNGDESVIRIHSDFKYNHTTLKTAPGCEDAFNAILNSYSEALDMDITTTSGNETVMYDIYNADGEISMKKAQYAVKRDTVQAMVDEMIEAGCINGAYYGTVNYGLLKGDYRYVEVVLPEDDGGSEYENIAAHLGSDDLIYGDFRIEDMGGGVYRIYTQEFTNDGMTTVVIMRNDYPDAEVDIAAEFEEKVYTYVDGMDMYGLSVCDVDGNGVVEVSDAAVILSEYAQNAAGIAAAAEVKSRDVNGDGVVDIEDATYVLELYAKNVAGLS